MRPEGDAIAAARRRLPMVAVDGATLLIGDPVGAVTLLDAFEGRRMLIAYYFMWQAGDPAPEQCEGCTWVTSQVRELSYIHARDATFAVLCQGPYDESADTATSWAGKCRGIRPWAHSRLFWWDDDGQIVSRLLPATRIESLRDLLDDQSRRRRMDYSYDCST